MMHDVSELSTYIINYYKDCHEVYIDNIKLNQILYLLQKNYIIKNNKLLFDDDIYMYIYGFMVKEIYTKYRYHSGTSFIYEPINKNSIEFSNDDEKFINYILDKYLNYKTWDLIEKSKKDSLFKKHENELKNNNYILIYQNELLREFS